MRPLERRPAISAGHTVVIANQTPFKFYGPDGPREPVWDVATVDENIGAWLGRPTWYAGGPLVHAVLTGHHAEEVACVDLAPAPWNESIDIDDWRLAGRRAPDANRRCRCSRDRKSTRLNSSHVKISYAVFCLKKKRKKYALSKDDTHRI